MTEPAVDSVLSRLLSYAAEGIPVLPIWGITPQGECMCPQGATCTRGKGKHPRTRHGVKDASTDRVTIESWVRANVGGNWAIATGHELTDGRYLCVLDVDPRNGGDETLRGIIAEQGPLPVTPTQLTGGGGTHYLFATAAKPTARVLGSGLDLQGGGKYALVEPSGHASGGHYTWDKSAAFGAVQIANAPHWITENVGKMRGKPELSGATARDSFLGEAFSQAGMLGVELDEGKWAVKCPWAHLHSDSRGRGQDSSTAILPPAVGSNSGGFNCQHGHCSHRKWADVVGALPAEAVATARKKYPVRPSLAAGAEVAAPVESDERVMADELILNKKKGVPEAILYNCVRILSADKRWAGRIRYNRFSDAVMMSGTPLQPADEEREWTDTDDARTQVWCRLHYGVDFGVADVQRAVDVVSKQDGFHPIRDYLETLKWDDVPRVDKFFHTYFNAEDSPYTRGVGSRWLISAVARVMEPGCQVDCLVVLEGKRQGEGKSTGLKALTGAEWFFDGDLDIGDKDARQNLKGKWIVEWAELDSLNRSEINKVKKFITNQVDEYRPSYGRRRVTIPRQCVFAGTTNETQYLKDTTGNRRFWPVTCLGACDVAAIRRDRDQIWAEVVVRYRTGERWHVDTPAFQRMCQEAQSERMHTDPWEDVVSKWVADPLNSKTVAAGLLGTDVLERVLKIDVAKMTKGDQMRIGEVLRSLGFSRGEPEQLPDDPNRRVRRYYFSGK